MSENLQDAAELQHASLQSFLINTTEMKNDSRSSSPIKKWSPCGGSNTPFVLTLPQRELHFSKLCQTNLTLP